MTPARRRNVALVALMAVVAAGLLVARGLPSSVFTDVAGDALYAVAAYTGLVLMLPRASRIPLVLAAAGWCVFVELLQRTGLPSTLAERMPPVALLLGTGFDPRDLLVYVLAVGAAAALDTAVGGRLRPPEETPRPV